MLVDLHAHNLVPGVLNQHPVWGPSWTTGPDGDLEMRIGEWVLQLSSKDRRDAVARGERLDPQEDLEKRADPTNRIAAMDAAGVDKLVVSLPSHMNMYWTDAAFAKDYAQLVNETNAKYCSAFPERLSFWAHLPLQDIEASIDELRRSVTELGSVGPMMGGANFGGREVDDPAFDPLWQCITELDVPIFVHGYNQSVTWGEEAGTDKYETTSVLGMNYDEARFFWHIVCGGVLDRFPGLKIYITHAGGFVPFQLGRMAATNSVLLDKKNERPLRDYLPNFWFDPYVHSLEFRRAIVEVIGVDRLVYGDNFGGSDGLRPDKTGDLTEGIGLSEDERERIRSTNAIQLLKLK